MTTPIAVIGLAISHAHRFTELLQPHGFRVAYVMDDCKEKAEAFSECYGSTIVEKWADLPWETLGGAIITTIADQHVSAAEPFLQRGIPVFIDKQIGLRWADAIRLEETARRGGTAFLSGSIRSFAPAYTSIARHLREGKAGDPLSLHLYEPHGIHSGGWQDDPSRSGGFLLSIGIHLAGPLIAVLGDEIEELYTITALKTHPDALSEDLAHIVVRYRSGAVATLLAMGAQKPIVATQPTLQLHTTCTTLSASLPEGCARIHSGGPLYDPESYDYTSGSLHAARAIAQLFRGGVPAVSIQDQLAGFKLLLLARRSAVEMRPVKWNELCT